MPRHLNAVDIHRQGAIGGGLIAEARDFRGRGTAGTVISKMCPYLLATDSRLGSSGIESFHLYHEMLSRPDYVGGARRVTLRWGTVWPGRC